MNEQDIIQGVTIAVTTASVVCAALPEPKTEFGKKIRRFIELLALNFNHSRK